MGARNKAIDNEKRLNPHRAVGLNKFVYKRICQAYRPVRVRTFWIIVIGSRHHIFSHAGKDMEEKGT